MWSQLHKLDFHIRKVEPSNSLKKREAQTGRWIQYMDVFEFPYWNEKFIFYHSILPVLMFSKSTQGCEKPSKTRAKSIKCSDIMCEHITIIISRTFTTFWLDNVQCPMSNSNFQHCIKILTWLRGLLVIFLYLVGFSLCASLVWELRDNGVVKNLQFWP